MLRRRTMHAMLPAATAATATATRLLSILPKLPVADPPASQLAATAATRALHRQRSFKHLSVQTLILSCVPLCGMQ
jgi:hypothetical protein